MTADIWDNDMSVDERDLLLRYVHADRMQFLVGIEVDTAWAALLPSTQKLLRDMDRYSTEYALSRVRRRGDR